MNPTLGQTLRQSRNSQGFTIERVSRDTRIPASALEDIENDRYARFDSPIYLKGFIRLYCEKLGIDGSPWIRAINAHIENEGHKPYLGTGLDPLEDSRPPAPARTNGLPVFLAPVLIAILVFLCVSLYRTFQSPLPEAPSSGIGASSPSGATATLLPADPAAVRSVQYYLPPEPPEGLVPEPPGGDYPGGDPEVAPAP